MRRTVVKKGKKTVEVVYLITSDRSERPSYFKLHQYDFAGSLRSIIGGGPSSGNKKPEFRSSEWRDQIMGDHGAGSRASGGLAMVDNISMIRSKFVKKISLLVMKEGNTMIGDAGRSSDEATFLYASSLLSNAREELDRADAKASVLLAASGVAAGALLAGLIAGSWTPLKLRAEIQWVWWLGITEWAVGICCLALAVYPRERKNDSGIPWTVGYYGDVLAYPTTSELVVALNRSAETSMERIADQLRHVSWIVDHKYRLLRWGMRGFFLAAVTIAAAMVVNLLLMNH